MSANSEIILDISVVIPTYNRGQELVRAVESALAQTYQLREIIVIDDGSTDDTVERLRPYREQIRYVYQANRGASAAQNSGIKAARGEWIAILASDDTWEPTKLEKQARLLLAQGEKFGACFTDCRYFGDSNRQATAFQEVGLDCPGGHCVVADPAKYILAKQPVFFVQSLLVQRALLLKINCFKDDLEIGEDTDLIFRLSFHTRFCVLGEPLVQIDRTPSLSRLIDLYQVPDIACRNIERRLEQWLQMPELVEAKIRDQIRSDLRSIYYSWAIAKLYRLEFAVSWKKLQKIRATGDSYLRVATQLAYRGCRRLLKIPPR